MLAHDILLRWIPEQWGDQSKVLPLNYDENVRKCAHPLNQTEVRVSFGQIFFTIETTGLHIPNPIYRFSNKPNGV